MHAKGVKEPNYSYNLDNLNSKRKGEGQFGKVKSMLDPPLKGLGMDLNVL